MLQPVLRNVAIDERVARDSRKPKNEQKTQRGSGESRDQKETGMFAQQFAHAGNIAESF
jgi:hypothetical protein